jgi:hypothetical protein
MSQRGREERKSPKKLQLLFHIFNEILRSAVPNLGYVKIVNHHEIGEQNSKSTILMEKRLGTSVKGPFYDRQFLMETKINK